MSNDLLFSVIPREGKEPIKTDDSVKRVSSSTHGQKLSDEEKYTHEQERQISEQQQHLVHRKTHQEQSGKQGKQEQQQSASSNEEELDDLTYDCHGEKTGHESPLDDSSDHVDTFG